MTYNNMWYKILFELFLSTAWKFVIDFLLTANKTDLSKLLKCKRFLQGTILGYVLTWDYFLFTSLFSHKVKYLVRFWSFLICGIVWRNLISIFDSSIRIWKNELHIFTHIGEINFILATTEYVLHIFQALSKANIFLISMVLSRA